LTSAYNNREFDQSANLISLQNTLSQIRGFKMGSLNIASLTKHLDELKVLMANEPLDILAINESRSA
jgi:hypothetical protein